jgi:hypothetical protein
MRIALLPQIHEPYFSAERTEPGLTVLLLRQSGRYSFGNPGGNRDILFEPTSRQGARSMLQQRDPRLSAFDSDVAPRHPPGA